MALLTSSPVAKHLLGLLFAPLRLAIALLVAVVYGGTLHGMQRLARVLAQASPRRHLLPSVPYHAEVGGLQREADVRMLAAPSAPAHPAALCFEARTFFTGAGARQFRGGMCSVGVLLDVLAPAVKFAACRVHPPAVDGSEGGGAVLQREPEAQLTKQMDEARILVETVGARTAFDVEVGSVLDCDAVERLGSGIALVQALTAEEPAELLQADATEEPAELVQADTSEEPAELVQAHAIEERAGPVQTDAAVEPAELGQAAAQQEKVAFDGEDFLAQMFIDKGSDGGAYMGDVVTMLARGGVELELAASFSAWMTKKRAGRHAMKIAAGQRGFGAPSGELPCLACCPAFLVLDIAWRCAAGGSLPAGGRAHVAIAAPPDARSWARGGATSPGRAAVKVPSPQLMERVEDFYQDLRDEERSSSSSRSSSRSRSRSRSGSRSVRTNSRSRSPLHKSGGGGGDPGGFSAVPPPAAGGFSAVPPPASGGPLPVPTLASALRGAPAPMVD
ncbi:unnamed protein product [Prorocentrum cordatum]|uniref:Uncharacterized protein n=1 Tax=Prorocentrum cordatum TaxID=2364126 RepID=A0ABN9TQ02_9DINO|nr:unnamed protein product [Polarella glacialis]